jgi:hypothetical protein
MTRKVEIEVMVLHCVKMIPAKNEEIYFSAMNQHTFV